MYDQLDCVDQSSQGMRKAILDFIIRNDGYCWHALHDSPEGLGEVLDDMVEEGTLYSIMLMRQDSWENRILFCLEEE